MTLRKWMSIRISMIMIVVRKNIEIIETINQKCEKYPDKTRAQYSFYHIRNIEVYPKKIKLENWKSERQKKTINEQ